MIITSKIYLKKLNIVYFFLNDFSSIFFISSFTASISFVDVQFFAATQNFINTE